MTIDVVLKRGWRLAKLEPGLGRVAAMSVSVQGSWATAIGDVGLARLLG